MNYYKVQLASRLENGIYYHDQNKFKYSLEDAKKIFDNPRVKALFDTYNMDLYVVDKAEEYSTIKQMTCNPQRVCARVTSINLDEGYAEVMCERNTYPMSNVFMDNLDHVAVGLIMLGNWNPEEDDDGYNPFKPNTFVKFQLVVDAAADGKKAELLGSDTEGYGNYIPVGNQ